MGWQPLPGTTPSGSEAKSAIFSFIVRMVHKFKYFHSLLNALDDAFLSRINLKILNIMQTK